MLKENIHGDKYNAAVADEEIVNSFEELETQHDGIRRNRREDDDPKYINCDFISGSCAEVEKLWSISKFILTSE